MTQYRDESHAVVRALNCGEGRPNSSVWQRQYASGYRESSDWTVDQLGPMDRLMGDAMTHALIRRVTSAEQYLTLVLRYSGDERARIEALKALVLAVRTPAEANTRAIAIGAWAGYRSQLPAGTDYDGKGVTPSTVRGYRMQIRKQLAGWHESAMSAIAQALQEAELIGGGV